MARLSHPANPPHVTPVVGQAASTVSGPQATMSSPVLRPLPHSPPRGSSDRPPLSPADCRTLEKILQSSSIRSPPQTPSPLEQGEQRALDAPCSADASDNLKEVDAGVVCGEATDTGYEDEDDSMELSDVSEGVTTNVNLVPLDGPSSLHIFKTDRRLQDSVSVHDEKDRMRYTGRHLSVTKQPKVQRREQASNNADHDDIAENPKNLSERRSLPTHSLDLVRSNEHRQPLSEGVKLRHRTRFSLQTVSEFEGVDGKSAELGNEPGVTIPDCKEAGRIEDSDLDGFNADNEDTVPRMTGGRRRRSSQGRASKSEPRGSLFDGPICGDKEARLLVPDTPKSTVQPPGHTESQFATSQTVPETPFTEAFSYYKQFKGTENSPPCKRRRNTALPEDIAEITDIAMDTKHHVDCHDHEELGIEAPATRASPARSALVDLEEMALPAARNILEAFPHSEAEEYNTPEIESTASTSSAEAVGMGEVEDTDESQKQLILYPQHPAFVNAISMIPATMFWATAAPIVKYTNMAVEILIDKLRDAYL